MNSQDPKEFETKVLDINPEAIIQKLRELGAVETPEFLQKRYVFDIKPENPESEGYGWVRLRTNGSKTTLTYKHKMEGNIKVGDTIEIETEVSDFDKTMQILSKIPFERVLYQENKSHIFKLNDIEFSIDTWPKLKPHLEVESTNLKKVQEGLRLLELEGKDVGDKDVVNIYLEQIGLDPNSLPELKFDQ